MKGVEAIAFDLDGTLVDSAGGVAHALNAALARHGLASFDLDRVRSWIGDGPDVLIRHALRAAGCPDSEQAALQTPLRRAFDEATLAAPMAGSHVFDGIAGMLDALRGDFPLAVVTNKPTPLARAVLTAARLVDRFQVVLGADEAAWRKPSAHLLCALADRLSLPTGALLMVGDAAPDAGAARAAGCAMAWAAWGYGHAPATAAWRLDTPSALQRSLRAAQEH